MTQLVSQSVNQSISPSVSQSALLILFPGMYKSLFLQQFNFTWLNVCVSVK